jgi:hypothetical protein
MFGIFDLRITKWVIDAVAGDCLCALVFIPRAVRLRITYGSKSSGSYVGSSLRFCSR